ncbi:MAG: ABC transporter ATP-binding protein [Alphaproteobacteria bacterium]|nr:ABC transporter ATP-binding protein [Alphaproteobacteria bacterium]
MQPFPKKFSGLLKIYLSKFKLQIFIALLLTILGILFENLNIRFFANIIGALKDNNENSYNAAIKYVYLLIGSSLGFIVFTNYSRYFFKKKFIISCKTLMEKELFSYLLGHSYEYITDKQSGMLITYKNQVKKMPDMLDSFMWEIRAFVDIIIKVVLLMMVSPVIGGSYFILCILVVLPGKIFTKNLKKVGSLKSKASALVNGRILDTVNNINIVKEFDNKEYEKKSFTPLLKQEFDLAVKSLKVFFMQFSAVGVATSFASFILLLLSVYYWKIDKITTADVTFVFMTIIYGLNWFGMLFDGIQRFVKEMFEVEKGLEIFNAPHEIVDKKSAKTLKATKGKIEFKNISFTYKNKKKPVFDNFNLTIKPKEKVGLVGASGSGKTTLINLLQRAFELDSGEILIDGKNICDVTQESLHQNISLIPQDTVMFNRNIYQNIVFGTNIKDIKKVRNASKKAYADEFIMEKEGGYESFAGDRGCKLSGGQRQRLAIARAILKDAPILILDEATSSLDSQSEKLINKAIENIINNQTVIAIAHRLSTLKNMDRIIVLDKGKIVEEGNFDELLKIKGKFFKLWQVELKKKGGKNV